MTSATGQDPHPEVLDISDLVEGILPPERAAEVHAHVESCVQCGQMLASLQEIRDLLGRLPQPGPMPADVAVRIDTALAAEISPCPALPHVPRETSLPARDTPEAASVPRGTSSPVSRPSAPAGPGRGRRRRRGLLIGAASAAAVLALGGVVYKLASDSGPNGVSADSSAPRKASAQSRGSSGTVGDEVARLLGGARGKPRNSRIPSPMLNTGGDARVTAPDGTVVTVPGCVLQATHRTQQPLAASREPFQGVDSYLVVLPDPADAARVDAFVVAASCTAGTPARVLFQDSFPIR